MKVFAILVTAASLLVGMAAPVLAADEIKVSYYEMAPYVIIDKESGELSGAAIDFMRGVAKEMGVEIKFDNKPTTSRIGSGKRDPIGS